MTRATVVIPYFEGQPGLDRALAGLDLQTLPPAEFDVVVADDGSAVAPVTGRRAFRTTVVRHENLGIRPGAARNLGARHGGGETLVFLDGDMVPEPRYLEELLRACDGRRLTVGRRRHAKLADVEETALRAWLSTGTPSPVVLPEPDWLAAGYADSADLTRSDLRSYRYVIAAVMAMPRSLFERLGGFAEEIDVYGGEDWELARRAWLAGADFVHAPDAVAWHDGPDLPGRPDAAALKNRETLRIADLVTDPHLRGRGLLWRHPRIVVRCGFPDRVSQAARIAFAEGVLAAGDVGVWFQGVDAPPIPDPRVHAGVPGPAVLQRCELLVDAFAPFRVEHGDWDAWQEVAPARSAQALVRSPRDEALGREPGALADAEPIPDELELEAWFGRTERRRG